MAGPLGGRQWVLDSGLGLRARREPSVANPCSAPGGQRGRRRAAGPTGGRPPERRWGSGGGGAVAQGCTASVASWAVLEDALGTSGAEASSLRAAARPASTPPCLGRGPGPSAPCLSLPAPHFTLSTSQPHPSPSEPPLSCPGEESNLRAGPRPARVGGAGPRGPPYALGCLGDGGPAGWRLRTGRQEERASR